MPPMPPMPPPGGMAAADSFFGLSATMASVVIRSEATEAASCSAIRTTLVGSMMPAETMSTYSSFCASKPKLPDFSSTLPTTIEPSTPAFCGDLADRRLERLGHDVDAGLDVGIVGLQSVDRLLGAEQRNAAARHNAFLDRGAGGIERVIDAVLALLHLDLGGTADLDHGNAAGELGQPLLQLLAVIVGGRLLDLRLDLGDAGLDVGLLAGAVDDRGVLLLDPHPLGAAEHVERHVLELDAEVFGDHLAAGQDGDVLEHGLAAIAEARRLDRRDLEAAAQLVDDEGGKRLAFDILGDDQQRTADCTTASRSGSIACRPESFFSCRRM